MRCGDRGQSPIRLQCPRPGVGRPSPASPQPTSRVTPNSGARPALPCSPRDPSPPQPAPRRDRAPGWYYPWVQRDSGRRPGTGDGDGELERNLRGEEAARSPALPGVPAEGHLPGGGLRAGLCGADAEAAEITAATSGAAAAVAEAAARRSPSSDSRRCARGPRRTAGPAHVTAGPTPASSRPRLQRRAPPGRGGRLAAGGTAERAGLAAESGSLLDFYFLITAEVAALSKGKGGALRG